MITLSLTSHTDAQQKGFSCWYNPGIPVHILLYNLLCQERIQYIKYNMPKITGFPAESGCILQYVNQPVFLSVVTRGCNNIMRLPFLRLVYNNYIKIYTIFRLRRMYQHVMMKWDVPLVYILQVTVCTLLEQLQGRLKGNVSDLELGQCQFIRSTNIHFPLTSG